MRRHLLARAMCATIVVAALLPACTSGSEGSGTGTSTGGPPSAPSASLDTPSVTPSPPDANSFGHTSAANVSIRPPDDGSFRVQGVYPWRPSSCVRPSRPSLDGRYPGALSIRTADDGTLSVIVTLRFHEYLEGIAEVPPTWPKAALEAQVIAARSYVLARIGWTGEEGESLDTPICSTADCQVYGGIRQPRPPGIGRWYEAVRNTRGQVLVYAGRAADAVYFSTSNGRTYGNDEVFGSSPLPFLRPVVERDDGASPLSRWRVELPFRDLATVLRAAGSWPRGTPISSVSVVGSMVRLKGGGEKRTVTASAIRDAARTWAPCLMPGRYPTAGLPTTIPSGWFRMSSVEGALVVQGRGWGHGVGMVQWGAYGKASRGWPASRILSFYYGGLTPQPHPEPGTIRVEIATGLRSMTVVPSKSGATIGDRTLGPGKLRITGGDLVTVSSAS